MDNEKLVKSIKKLCQKNNISISQLENDLNFSPSLISRWKDKNPNIDRIIDIADYFHVSLDEVVGYNTYENDNFLNELYEQTSKGMLIWKNGHVIEEQNKMFKLYSRTDEPGYIMNEDYKETTYAIQFQTGYIAVYAYHYYNKLLNPEDIILFIQPSDESFLVDQHYTKEELTPLWIKILNSLGDKAPDEVKAEDLKISFLNEAMKAKEPNKISSNKNSSIKINGEQVKQAISTDPNNPKNYRKIFGKQNI